MADIASFPVVNGPNLDAAVEHARAALAALSWDPGGPRPPPLSGSLSRLARSAVRGHYVDDMIR